MAEKIPYGDRYSQASQKGEDRLYPLIFKMNEEIKSLTLQVRALRSAIERDGKNEPEK